MQNTLCFSFTCYEVWEYELVPLEITDDGARISSIVGSILSDFEKGIELARMLRKGYENAGIWPFGPTPEMEGIYCQSKGRQERRMLNREVMDRLERIIRDAKANGNIDGQPLILFLQSSSAVIKRIWRESSDALTSLAGVGSERIEKLLAEICFDFNTTLVRLASLRLVGGMLTQENGKRQCRLELLDAAARTAERTGRALLSPRNGPSRNHFGPSTLRLSAVESLQRDGQRQDRSKAYETLHPPQNGRAEHRKRASRKNPRKITDKPAASSSPPPVPVSAVAELHGVSRQHSSQQSRPMEREGDRHVAELAGQHVDPASPSPPDPADLEPVIPSAEALYPPSADPPPYSPTPHPHEISVPNNSGPPSEVSVASSDHLPLGEIPAHRLAKPVSQTHTGRQQRSRRGAKSGFWTKWMGKSRRH